MTEIKVSQRAREAAATLARATYLDDDHPTVQAFARFEQAIRASNDAEPFGREAERMVVARCIQIIFDIRDEFLSPEYAVDQPLGSLMERVACDLCIDAIGAEFVMSSNEQRILVGRPSHIEEYRTTK